MHFLLVHPKTEWACHENLPRKIRQENSWQLKGGGCARDVPAMKRQISCLGKNPSLEFAQNHGNPPKNNMIRMEHDIPKGSDSLSLCHPQGRSGFREVLVHVSLALLMGLAGEDHDDEQALIAKRRVLGKSCFVAYLMFIRCDPLAFFLCQISENDSFSTGMELTLDEFCGQWNSHPWATHWLFVKMLAYGSPAKRGHFCWHHVSMHLQ